MSCVIKYSPYWSACSSLSEECFATCAHCGGWSVVTMVSVSLHAARVFMIDHALECWHIRSIMVTIILGKAERGIIRSAMDTFNAYYFINKSELLLHYQSRHLNSISDIILFCIKTSCLCSLVHIMAINLELV